jgi:mono/diheme cytochrome c family protein
VQRRKPLNVPVYSSIRALPPLVPIGLVLAAAVLLSGCQPKVQTGSAERPSYAPLGTHVVKYDFIPERPNADAGEKTYQARCAVCHGADGGGAGPMAATLVAPHKNPLTDTFAIFRVEPHQAPLPSRPRSFSNLDQMRLNSPFAMYETIYRGRPHTAMPGFSHPAYGANDAGLPRLHGQEIWNVLFWEWSRATKKETLAQGKRIYEAQCASCHGAAGDGKGPESAKFHEQVWTWTRQMGPGVFVDRDWMAYRKPVDLYQTTVQGVERRGLKLMSAYGEKLTPDEIWAVVDYIWTFVYTPPADRR